MTDSTAHLRELARRITGAYLHEMPLIGAILGSGAWRRRRVSRSRPDHVCGGGTAGRGSCSLAARARSRPGGGAACPRAERIPRPVSARRRPVSGRRDSGERRRGRARRTARRPRGPGDARGEDRFRPPRGSSAPRRGADRALARAGRRLSGGATDRDGAALVAVLPTLVPRARARRSRRRAVAAGGARERVVRADRHACGREPALLRALRVQAAARVPREDGDRAAALADRLDSLLHAPPHEAIAELDRRPRDAGDRRARAARRRRHPPPPTRRPAGRSARNHAVSKSHGWYLAPDVGTTAMSGRTERTRSRSCPVPR